MEYKAADNKLMLLMGLFAGLFVLANFLAVKQIQVGSFIITLGLLSFPFMFLITDIINEVYGDKIAAKVVRNGFVVMVVVAVISQIAVYLPPAAHFAGEGQQAFARIFGLVPRITVASLLAYIVSQHLDVWGFAFWRRITKGKHLWLRNNLSTIVSQAVDSVLFIGIAFIGVVPTSVLISMVVSQWVVKWIIALVETPICYLGVAWAKKE